MAVAVAASAPSESYIGRGVPGCASICAHEMTLKALIVGGGPAGLSAAYVLKKQCNIDSEIFEADKELAKVIRDIATTEIR